MVPDFAEVLRVPLFMMEEAGMKEIVLLAILCKLHLHNQAPCGHSAGGSSKLLKCCLPYFRGLYVLGKGLLAELGATRRDQ